MKNKLKLILLLFFIFANWLLSSCYAQTNQVSEALVDSLNEQAFTIKRTDIVKALNVLYQSQKIAHAIDYKKGLAVGFLYEAGIYQQSGFTNKALSIYYKSLDLSKKINDSFNIARCNLQIAASLMENNKDNEAEDLYNQSLKIFELSNNQKEVANIYNNLGYLKHFQKKQNEALRFFLKALEISKNIAYIYGEKKAYQNLGLYYSEQKIYPIANEYFNKAVAIDSKVKDNYGLSFSKYQLATIALLEKKNELCLEHSLEGYKLAKAAQAISLMENNIRCVMKAYGAKNMLQEINNWQDTLITIVKEQNKLDKQYAINFVDLIREQEVQTLQVQEEAINANSQSKIRLWIILIGSFFLLVAVVFALIAFRNFNRQKILTQELKEKNAIIKKNNESLDAFNKAIADQNERLEEQNKLKDKLLSIISHDLRHPMINTKGIIDMINAQMVSPEEQKELLALLTEQYGKNITLLDNLLFWLKGQMKGGSLNKKVINVPSFFKEIIAEQEVSFHKKNITVHNMVTEWIYIQGDAEMLKIVFRNLLNNAIKFTPAKGTISILYKKEHGQHCFIVKDTGTGMTAAELEKINLKNYYTTTGTLDEKGTGFGIMLCHDLINKHGGILEIESEKNIGSTFIVKLPIDTPTEK